MMNDEVFIRQKAFICVWTWKHSGYLYLAQKMQPVVPQLVAALMAMSTDKDSAQSIFSASELCLGLRLTSCNASWRGYR